MPKPASSPDRPSGHLEHAESAPSLPVPDTVIEAFAQRVAAELVEPVARRVVELQRVDGEREGLLSAAEAARRLGRSREWVYRHAAELGGMRLGEGERPRLGFPPEKVADYC